VVRGEALQRGSARRGAGLDIRESRHAWTTIAPFDLRPRSGCGGQPLNESGHQMLEGRRHDVAPGLQMSVFIGSGFMRGSPSMLLVLGGVRPGDPAAERV
jgi:hypothetical protein